MATEIYCSKCYDGKIVRDKNTGDLFCSHCFTTYHVEDF